MTKFAAMMAVDDVATQLEFHGEVIAQTNVHGSTVGDASEKVQIPVQVATTTEIDSEVQFVEKTNIQGTAGKPEDNGTPSMTPQKCPLEPAHEVTDEPALKSPTL